MGAVAKVTETNTRFSRIYKAVAQTAVCLLAEGYLNDSGE